MNMSDIDNEDFNQYMYRLIFVDNAFNLTKLQTDVVIDYYYNRLQYKHIAEKHGFDSENNARSVARGAIKKMQRRLSKPDHERIVQNLKK